MQLSPWIDEPEATTTPRLTFDGQAPRCAFAPNRPSLAHQEPDSMYIRK
jgi:hypothetical protein